MKLNEETVNKIIWVCEDVIMDTYKKYGDIVKTKSYCRYCGQNNCKHTSGCPVIIAQEIIKEIKDENN